VKKKLKMNIRTGTPTIDPSQMNRNSDGFRRRSARASSRARFAPKSRPSTTLFLALSDQVADRALAGADRLGAIASPGGIALKPVGDARAAGAGDTEGDQDDRQGGDAGDGERHWIHDVLLRLST
jgi:hypothetical protein